MPFDIDLFRIVQYQPYKTISFNSWVTLKNTCMMISIALQYLDFSALYVVVMCQKSCLACFNDTFFNTHINTVIIEYIVCISARDTMEG